MLMSICAQSDVKSAKRHQSKRHCDVAFDAALHDETQARGARLMASFFTGRPSSFDSKSIDRFRSIEAIECAPEPTARRRRKKGVAPQNLVAFN